MKPFHKGICSVLAMLASCQNDDSPNSVVTQKFIHKYGFDVSEAEWETRAQEGQIISVLKNGVKVTRSFENGVLHGITTHSFPFSNQIEKSESYDQGTLLKETVYDIAGIPIKEQRYELDDRMMVTTWNDQGVPISVEEYSGDLLIGGTYYTPEHELEAEVTEGFGERIKRDRHGLLISKDIIEDGVMSARTTYHPNGQIHTISHYHDYQLHGEQKKFALSGRPLMQLNWDHGVLDGTKIIFRNGFKVAEIPYTQGQKNGTEYHYDDLGHLTAETTWRHDQKHGLSRLYTEESSETDWFFNGQEVSLNHFKALEERERLIAQFNETNFPDFSLEESSVE